MYRKKEEQKEMLTVCENLINDIFDAYDKKELDKVAFISKCSFVCGFLYATYGDGAKYEVQEALIKLLIDLYQSVEVGDNEKE